ncbi:helix-turn-helix transcriptional regulator [Streptomyces sp. NPDC047315]|uniref:helix-turn-helix transcriptional regulator n=1 Tax=Streptomyces sp. NPDC047315 TaxID=3155142 RepID=UPI0033FC52A0
MQTDADPGETFPQILARLKDAYGDVSDSEIARRINMSPAAVSLWAQGKRTPRLSAIRAIHAAFPAIPEAELLAAVGRKAPGPLSPDATERLLALFSELTEEQQEIKEIELRAIVEANRKK